MLLGNVVYITQFQQIFSYIFDSITYYYDAIYSAELVKESAV